MIVLDSSVLVEMLIGGHERASLLRRKLIETPAMAPYHIDLEVFSALRRYERLGRLSKDRGAMAVVDLGDFPIERVPHRQFRQRIWELRHNMTPYDAVYVALAELFDAPLWTFDKRLANAPGARCEIVVPSV
ncbi:type II toxin-antitoxin system VapC family toxin [Glycomyces arizonensis]|uniref:type II toxin-antitoxin system VapC family toxin n=1 Tax=Glycomyces arizonensis TaxID=256035 RepID=UPI000420B63C|nr:type II toxin-antitoxin system VapC family toxin [Glycomyces arizonensis]